MRGDNKPVSSVIPTCWTKWRASVSVAFKGFKPTPEAQLPLPHCQQIIVIVWSHVLIGDKAATSRTHARTYTHSLQHRARNTTNTVHNYRFIILSILKSICRCCCEEASDRGALRGGPAALSELRKWHDYLWEVFIHLSYCRYCPKPERAALVGDALTNMLMNHPECPLVDNETLSHQAFSKRCFCFMPKLFFFHPFISQMHVVSRVLPLFAVCLFCSEDVWSFKAVHIWFVSGDS